MSVAMNRLTARRAARLALAGLATLWLAACSMPDSMNPVNWYRDTMGLSEDDPPEDARNTGNLAAGNTRDYPNLATVPPTPTRALSTAEREALTQRLISDRANAKYIDDAAARRPFGLHRLTAAGFGGDRERGPSGACPHAFHPALASPAPAAASEAAVPPASPPTVAAASPPSPSSSPAPPATGAGRRGTLPHCLAERAATQSAAADVPAPPPAATPPAVTPPAPAAASAPTPPRSAPWVSLTAPPPAPAEQEASAPPPAPITPAAPVVDANGQPRESPLTSPTVRSIPEPETPASGAAAPRTRAGRHRRWLRAWHSGRRTHPTQRPAAFAGGRRAYRRSDFRRQLGPFEPIRPTDRRAGHSAAATDRWRRAVVGYAAKAGGTASEQLANFRIALDRANAVASVLAQSGVAPDQILIETAPPTGERGVTANRAEIFLEN